MNIYAQYNHARWVAICPRCLLAGKTVALEVRIGDVFVCPEEYPNLMAKTLVPNPRMPGAFNPVADVVLQREARQSALASGNCYEVIFPEEKAEIERVLRVRPAYGRNWFQGVSLRDLIEENERIGINA